jgi:hypothetical protein
MKFTCSKDHLLYTYNDHLNASHVHIKFCVTRIASKCTALQVSDCRLKETSKYLGRTVSFSVRSEPGPPKHEAKCQLHTTLQCFVQKYFLNF